MCKLEYKTLGERKQLLQCKWKISLVCSRNRNKVSRDNSRRGSDIFVLAYDSDFQAYPPNFHYPLILCLCPCHWNQMINGAFYVFSSKYIILDFYWAWSTENTPFQPLPLGWRNIVIYSKQQKPFIFKYENYEETPFWPDVVFIFPLAISRLLLSFSWLWAVSWLIKGFRFQVLIPT